LRSIHHAGVAEAEEQGKDEVGGAEAEEKEAERSRERMLKTVMPRKMLRQGMPSGLYLISISCTHSSTL
jgi:hypothetical protein